ncbi:helix-turn-helix domain-containing protein [Streptomyces anulatus]|uniref:helix-turn-helix domain-containing protein n=1 Tax=Streptomyces anulatus TaxID=1892 RepID=UPI001C5E15C1|nr:helix-turn-helix domain-containing protein [Streptomyces anulatus]QYA98262.1 helix-turn-helix domain-containing protein [Streptomyces anulatus]
MATAGRPEKNRQAPRADTRRDLLLFSGNECAWKTCSERLMNEDGGWVGEMAHIRGAEPGSARHDPALSKEELRSDENLVLLCANHHQRIDDPRSSRRYDVEFLQQMKRKHEERYRKAVAAAEDEISDLTRENTVIPSADLQRVEPDFEEEEREYFVPRVNEFADRLREVTKPARGLLAVVISRPTVIGAPEAARRIGRDRATVYDLVRELEAAGLAYIDTEWFEDETPEGVIVHPLCEDWPEFWDVLRDHMADRDDATVDDVIVGLNFSLLDRP